MVSSWTRCTKYKIFAFLLPTNQTMFKVCGFIDTFKTVPVSFWNIGQFWFETIGMVTFVTTITK